MNFPQYRPRRMREDKNIRRMVRENRLSVDMLIYPLFIIFGKGIKEEISSMPGNFRLSVDMLAEEIKEIVALGIPAVVLFGIPETKDDLGTEAYNPDGVVQQVRRCRRFFCCSRL